MKAQIMRSFAGGLLLATSICGAVYLFGSNEIAHPTKQPAQPAKQPLQQEMIDALTSVGFVVKPAEEWKKQPAAKEAPKVNPKEEPSKADSAKEKVVYRTILSVSKGMTSIDIEKILKSTKSIDPTIHFSKEVEKRGLSNKLRPGIYQIDSGMTMEEIIAVIFK
ncbi:hypothetical protein ACIQD3_23235 [Peribacillus loiseleuriae]|uniref:hypothetical protein n=1 Tax=Peribacillus loiseleuriae TaxID=1679170 RepID=UPI00381ED976